MQGCGLAASRFLKLATLSRPAFAGAQPNMRARSVALTRGARLRLQKRIQRDACAPQYSITFDDVTKDATTLTVSSASGNCDAGVMIASSAVTGADPNPRVSCPLFLLPCMTCPLDGSGCRRSRAHLLSPLHECCPLLQLL
jgi:hypothetical protein